MQRRRLIPPSRILASTLATGLLAGAPAVLAAPQDPQGDRGEVFVPAGASNWPFYSYDGRCWLGGFPSAGPDETSRFISSHSEDFTSFHENVRPKIRACAVDTVIALCDGETVQTGTRQKGTVLAFHSGHSLQLVATAGQGTRTDPGWSLQWSGQCEPPAQDPDHGDGPGDGNDGTDNPDAPDRGTNDIDDIDDGDGGDGGDGGCFLTTAIVHQRGLEADDGPTLTTLRRFRDRYMMTRSDGRALLAEYQAVAPAIVAAIPAEDPEWRWIAGRIDASVDAIRRGDDHAACAIYVDMVRRLQARWLRRAGLPGSRT